MNIRNWSRWQIGVIAVPVVLLLAALALAWNTDTSHEPRALSVPDDALNTPASVTRNPLGIDLTAGHAQTVSTLQSNGIPPVALAAYRTAADLLGEADSSCRLPWNLVAAIGRVESNHGRALRRTLGDDGAVTPPLFGPRVSYGKSISERPAGPFQFVPELWKAVGVDVDGDGRKDPHDIDDAATAAAVYLCAGDADLSTSAGLTAALKRYNPSARYGRVVAEISEVYASGKWDGGVSEVPESVMVQAVARDQALAKQAPSATASAPDQPAESPRANRTPAPPNATSAPSRPAPKPKPTKPSPTASPTPTSAPDSSGGVSDLIEGVGEDLGDGNLDSTLTWAEAKTRCLGQGLSALDVAGLLKCITDLLS